MSTASLIEKYNIKSRLIELVILFIAVSLGFVVENYREDYSEKQNAKELLSSMLTDLQGDIIRFETFTDARKKLINDVYSFIDDVENRGLLKDDLIQQKLFSMAIFNWTYFEPNTANIEQVISSGALRYLGNIELIHQIGVLESQNARNPRDIDIDARSGVDGDATYGGGGLKAGDWDVSGCVYGYGANGTRGLYSRKLHGNRLTPRALTPVASPPTANEHDLLRRCG